MTVRTKKILRFFAYSSLILFFLFALLLVWVFSGERALPDFVVNRIAGSLSSTNVLVTVESATFHHARGIRFMNVRVFDRQRHALRADEPVEPMLSAAQVELKLDLLHFPLRKNRMLREVVVKSLKYPRLPEGYYIPDSIEYGGPDFQERNEPLELDLPEIRPFGVHLIRPEILGIVAEDVYCPRVEISPRGMSAEGIHLRWPDKDVSMAVDGKVALDLPEQAVRGEVRGFARQSNIRPMLVALDITNSYQFIDAFTDAVEPVDSSCRFDVDLRRNDLHLRLDLHPPSCRHHGVPVRDVQGPLDIRVFVRDTYQNAKIVVGPLRVELADDTHMSGTVVYENTNDVGFVDFDTRMATSLPNALAIADVFTDGTLDCIRLESTPQIQIKGRLAVDPANAALNDLSGSLAFEKGSVFSVALCHASCDFRVQGTDIVFTNACAVPPNGGSVKGGAVISVPNGEREQARFDLHVKGDGVALKDVAEMFSLDLGDRHGALDGFVRLAGPLETNALDRLTGSGHLVCRNGHLAQMKAFSGLTDILSQKVPALAKHAPAMVGLVNQSRASLDFTVTNGLFRTSNLVIEGTMLSVQASGCYDMLKDDLDFRVRVTFTRDDSFFATLATPITWPFANLTQRIFEFRIQGRLDKPTWSFNRNLIDRLKR